MVAEEVPAVARDRVGVKRSREQPADPTCRPVEMRPALDADPARPVLRRTMAPEGRRATAEPEPARPSAPIQTARPPSLLSAPLLTATTAGIPLTHGLLGSESGRPAEAVGHGLEEAC